MGTLDGNGIYIYDTDDQVAPLQTLLNLGQSATSQALTEAKQDVIDTLTPDSTGWQTGALLYGLEGWTNGGDTSQTRMRRRGNRVFIQILMRRTGPAIWVPSDTGDLSNQNIVQVREAWRPSYGQPLHGRERTASFSIGIDGTIQLHSIAGTKNIATNDVLHIWGTYYMD